MKRDLPPLNALRAFEAAARHLSFKEAADELSVTPAAISQQVKALEAHIGVTLFHRRVRALELTEIGRLALPMLTSGFDRLAEGAALLGASARSNVLVVSVAPSFGGKWLVPRLEKFRRAHPGFDVRVDASEALATFRGDGIDLAIRYGRGTYGPELESVCIIEEVAEPVCSPSLLQAGPPLKTPSDLRHFTLLHVDVPHTSGVFPNWRMWLQAVGADAVDPDRGPVFNLVSMAVDAAVAGQGVALAGRMLAGHDINAGRLVNPFARQSGNAELGLSYFLVFPKANAKQPKIAAFRRWIEAEIASDAALVEGRITPNA